MVLLGLILLVSSGTLTSPMPLTRTAEGPSDQLATVSDNPPDPRNPYSIAFTCIITMFLCAWSSVHPNIAPTDISWWTRKKLRIELLFWTIIAPELVLSWAMSQWMGARRLARRHKADGWTMTHGFFLMMGGLYCVREDGTRHVLKHDNGIILPVDRRLWNLNKDRILFESLEPSQIQQITNLVSSKEIQDKSKSDFLSKSITALQTTWFIVQCIARAAQGLSITELELTTIAIAMLNVFMMFFWWHKPMDVEVPILLHLGSCPWKSNQPGLICEMLGYEESEEEDESEGMRELLNKLLTTGFLSPLMHIIFHPEDNNNINSPHSDTRFTVIRLRTKEHWARFAFLAVTASVFGGLHLVAWSFTFPSRGSWVCWQTAALIIAAGPCFFAFMNFVKNNIIRLSTAAAFILLLVTPLLYIAARLTLLIEALVLLAYIPPDGLNQVDWLRFIPHL